MEPTSAPSETPDETDDTVHVPIDIAQLGTADLLTLHRQISHELDCRCPQGIGHNETPTPTATDTDPDLDEIAGDEAPVRDRDPNQIITSSSGKSMSERPERGETVMAYCSVCGDGTISKDEPISECEACGTTSQLDMRVTNSSHPDWWYSLRLDARKPWADTPEYFSHASAPDDIERPVDTLSIYCPCCGEYELSLDGIDEDKAFATARNTESHAEHYVERQQCPECETEMQIVREDWRDADKQGHVSYEVII